MISNTVKSAAENLFGETIRVETCGSYRRGKPQCGDVDILITRMDEKPLAGMLELLVMHLQEKGFLKECLSLSEGHLNKTKEMYMGVCKMPGANSLARRIDIKIYPKESYGFALLYFTGSDYFNRSMRLFADKKGFTLSDHGLIPTSKAKGSKVSKGIGIPCQTEEEVFKALGLPYKTPAERDL